ncbi:uroporphyrinogen-III synthase [Pseudosulfitobacter koreensis]|uniref:Uroporphyrinogen-III synthase n=1 Tax=Pseudosulfitobacter koreensis TaxID=2968472 RepID=A0ABT1YX17_9RHOB|nr:uroporphyrinogen-III synthase [Pseudosulfitobacter koreense]MCR8825435.1 uroporphyrinogen-III synthase [Pseudosulfitobacter koreense]
MTRPEDGARAFVAALPDRVTRHCDVVISPLMRIQALSVEWPDFDAAIFTSVNGVAHGPEAKGRRAFCVGRATAEAAAKAGWRAQASGQDAETLLASLIALQPERRLVHFSGIHTRDDVAARLRNAGLSAEALAVYDQVPMPLNDAAQNALSGENPVIVPLFSPRSALHFSQGVVGTAPLYLGAISAAAAENCAEVDKFALIIARNPDRASMIEVVQILLDKLLSA